MAGGTHTVMPKKLAQALMEAGVQHFDVGGDVMNGIGSIASGPFTGVLGNSLNNALGTTFPGMGGKGMGADWLTGASSGVNNNTNATAPSIVTQDFIPGINQAQQRQTDVYNQQQNLAQALLNQSQGGGPNPAQAQLAQNTGANVAQQGALMASQRGASANPALLARQAAMQGSNIQQNSVGQAATLQAQQQLAAQNALANQQAQMGNQALQGESVKQGGLAAQNTALTTGGLGAQGINAQAASQNASTHAGILGGVLGGAGAALGSFFAKGGQVQHLDVGGPVNDELGIAHYDAPAWSMPGASGMTDTGGKALSGGMTGMGGGLGSLFGAGAAGEGAAGGFGAMAGGAGDAIPLIAEGAAFVNQGGKIHPSFSQALLNGGNVPGQAEVEGDSKKNDTVPTMLSPGEIVLPRSVTQAPDMEKKAVEFLKHLKGNKSGGYGSVLDARKMCGGGRAY